MSVNAFITGSRRYGRPKTGSDIDLVLRVDRETIDFFAELAGIETAVGYPRKSYRFGELNLLLCETDEEFATWQEGTGVLLRMKEKSGNPVSRDQAVAVFRALRAGMPAPTA